MPTARSRPYSPKSSAAISEPRRHRTRRPPFERALSSTSESSLRPGVCATVEAVLLLSIAVLSALGVVHDASAFDQSLLFPKAVVIALVLQLCLYYNDLYEDFGWHGRVAIFVRVGQSV